MQLGIHGKLPRRNARRHQTRLSPFNGGRKERRATTLSEGLAASLRDARASSRRNRRKTWGSALNAVTIPLKRGKMPFVTGITPFRAGTANKIGFRPRSGVTTSRMNKFIHSGPTATPYPFLSMIFPLSSCPFSIHAGMSLFSVHLLRRAAPPGTSPRHDATRGAGAV